MLLLAVLRIKAVRYPGIMRALEFYAQTHGRRPHLHSHLGGIHQEYATADTPPPH